MVMFKFLAVTFVLALAFYKAESKYLPRLRGMVMEKSFDQASGRCRYFDRLYEEGQAMVPDEECGYQCTCHVSEHYEGFLCEPLCPRYIDQSCRPGWENKPQMVPAGPRSLDACAPS
ncbi:hypothetical protein OS493_030736 [Desmophyllum pertusum]|uniref:Uncharacterized protein n=1 Tax=Desmophyllum pertusum TaxID=174260 RepID=A0A9X0CVJ1_9CNID|nr:hypothetical protein OS493_030736 [Desmophyllum pertusum]